MLFSSRPGKESFYTGPIGVWGLLLCPIHRFKHKTTEVYEGGAQRASQTFEESCLKTTLELGSSKQQTETAAEQDFERLVKLKVL